MPGPDKAFRQADNMMAAINTKDGKRQPHLGATLLPRAGSRTPRPPRGRISLAPLGGPCVRWCGERLHHSSHGLYRFRRLQLYAPEYGVIKNGTRPVVCRTHR